VPHLLNPAMSSLIISSIFWFARATSHPAVRRQCLQMSLDDLVRGQGQLGMCNQISSWKMRVRRTTPAFEHVPDSGTEDGRRQASWSSAWWAGGRGGCNGAGYCPRPSPTTHQSLLFFVDMVAGSRKMLEARTHPVWLQQVEFPRTPIKEHSAPLLSHRWEHASLPP
jgi:hypothetical protein